MAANERRGIPDNLDPLVDTLSNVVGILVIVVALTQIQLGDALDRVAELDAQRGREERAYGAERPSALDAIELRRDALFRRSDADPEEAEALARSTLARLEAMPTEDSAADGAAAELRARLESGQRLLAESRTAIENRSKFATALQRVEKQKVARLPDPTVIRGRESWVLVRHGRVFLVDREKLYEAGSSAITRILAGIPANEVTREALEDVDFYLRKKDIGFGNFRWRLRTQPKIRAEVEWRNLDVGLEPTRLETDLAFATWLAIRDPKEDVIHFQVWADSFEAYLAARERVERAGFKARWTGFETDQEIVIPIRYGAETSRTRPMEVD